MNLNLWAEDARLVVGADGRKWAIRRTVQWRRPRHSGTYELEVVNGHNGTVVVFTGLGLFWAVVVYLYVGSTAHIPQWEWLVLAVTAVVLGVAWLFTRTWLVVAETAQGVPEQWIGVVVGRGQAKVTVRVAARSIVQQGHPGGPDSRLRQVVLLIPPPPP